MAPSKRFLTPARVKGHSAAIAAALSLLMIAGCSDDREAPTAASESVQPATDQSEQSRENMREPQRDMSIDNDTAEAAEMAQFAMIDLATAQIKPTDGNEVFGTVEFRPSDDQRSMQVVVDISGLAPGDHGFHIHETGDCSAPDASSAGGHLNPYRTRHGGPGEIEHHVGDLGNVNANKDGRVDVTIQVEDLAFSGPASILQKALVIHAAADDLNTDPAGASGDRVGCGVISQQSDKGV